MRRVLLAACCAFRLTGATLLEVHVYDWAETPASVLAEARRVVTRRFADAGIQVRWTLEAPTSPEARTVVFIDPPRPAMLRKVECSARRDIALLLRPGHSGVHAPSVMGYAEPLASAGINANIYMARVQTISELYGLTKGTVAGYAIAHEIGHVLLRTAAHASGGIMAGNWNAEQFQRMRTAALVFSRSEGRRMQAAINGEGCGTTTDPQIASRQ